MVTDICICPECRGYEVLIDEKGEETTCWFCEGSGEWPPNYEYIKEKALKKQQENCADEEVFTHVIREVKTAPQGIRIESLQTHHHHPQKKG